MANYVLMEYGSGAVMAVPAHDERDFEFARKYHLPLHPVIQPPDQTAWDFQQAPYTEPGILIDSDAYTGLNSATARQRITEDLIAHNKGSTQVNYRLHDWGISRQRYWGTPIPIIYCSQCGTVPVPEQDLPVVLPENISLKTPQSPLTTLAEFYETSCPRCQQPARRETDTFDTFMESSWYYMRYCCPDQQQKMLDQRANYWLPVDHYIGGIEHAVMHLLYARFMCKVLRDVGLVTIDEPFTRLLTQGMVLKDGAKMSKSKGNVVPPTELIARYGADTARLFAIFAAPPELSLEWSDSGVEGCYRFLRKLWSYAVALKSQLDTAPTDTIKPATSSLRQEVHQILQQANFDMARLQLNTVVSAAMKIFNLLPKIEQLATADLAAVQETFSILLRLLAPITPHITHALWRALGFGENIAYTDWPTVDETLLHTTSLQLVVQVNGKLRGHIVAPADASKETIEQLALAQENVQRILAGNAPKKVIIVPKKLINIVI